MHTNTHTHTYRCIKQQCCESQGTANRQQHLRGEGKGGAGERAGQEAKARHRNTTPTRKDKVSSHVTAEETRRRKNR